MTRRVTRRCNESQTAVAENIVVALDLRRRMLGLEARPAAFERPFVFGLLHVKHSLRKHLDIADVIRMGVGHRHSLDVGRLDTKLFELGGERF